MINRDIFFAGCFIILTSGNVFSQEYPAKISQDSSKITTSDSKEVRVLAKEEDKLVIAQAIKNLEFEFDRATIDPVSFNSLNGLANWLKERNFTLKISGHADFIGSEAYNLKLSFKRAAAVKNYLVNQGADTELIDALGLGEGQPIASNATVAGRQKNRRVEFTLY